MTEYGCAVSQNFNHLLSCVYAHAYVASLLICGRAEQIGRVVGWRPGPWWEEIEGGCLMGALPSLEMLTLGCLSTLATNKMDQGAVAHTEASPSSVGVEHKLKRG